MAVDVDIVRAPVVTGMSPGTATVRQLRAPVVTGMSPDTLTVRQVRRVVLVNLAGVPQPASVNPTTITEMF